MKAADRLRGVIAFLGGCDCVDVHGDPEDQRCDKDNPVCDACCIAKDLECAIEEHEAELREAVAEERASIVAGLREWAADDWPWLDSQEVEAVWKRALSHAVDAIEDQSL